MPVTINEFEVVNEPPPQPAAAPAPQPAPQAAPTLAQIQQATKRLQDRIARVTAD
jgi:hypothetical protein